MNKRSLNTILFVLLCALIILANLRPASGQSNNAAPQDAVTGIWSAQDVSYAPWTFVLRNDGNRLTGTVSQGRYNNSGTRATALTQPVEIYDGTIRGDAISFECHSPGSADRKITFTGQINGDEITFTRTVEVRPGGSPGEDGLFGLSGAQRFVAKRQSGPDAQRIDRGPVTASLERPSPGGSALSAQENRPPGRIAVFLSTRPLWPKDGNTARYPGRYVFEEMPEGNLVVSYPSRLGAPDVAVNPGEQITFRVRLAKNIRPDLGVRVRVLPDGNYEYRYSVRNGEGSQDAIASWHLDVQTLANLSVSAPLGWQPSTSVSRPGTENLRSMTPGSHLVHWAADGSSQNGGTGNVIPPGSVVDGFQMISNSRPGFVTAYFQGGAVSSEQNVNLPDVVKRQLDAATSVTEASVSQMILGPKFTPNDNPVATVMEFSQDIQPLIRRGLLNPASPFVQELTAVLDNYRAAAAAFGGSVAEFVGPPLVVSTGPNGALESEVALAFRMSLASQDREARQAMGIDPARTLAEQQQQVIQRDMSAVRRVSLSDFPGLPAPFSQRIEQHGCIVPLGGEPFIPMGNGEQREQPPNNVLSGEFARSGQTDWAVLCSAGSQSSILLFWGGSTTCPDELATESNDRYVSKNDQGVSWFSRMIREISHQEIEDELKPSEAGGYTGGTIPPDFASEDHQGIIVGPRYGYDSAVYFCSQGKWFRMNFTAE